MREHVNAGPGLRAAAVTRRRFLGATAAPAAGLALPASSGAAHAASRTRLTLPAPTGPHEIGVRDNSRAGGSGMTRHLGHHRAPPWRTGVAGRPGAGRTAAACTRPNTTQTPAG
jgi:hypothetical protein